MSGETDKGGAKDERVPVASEKTLGRDIEVDSSICPGFKPNAELQVKDLCFEAKVTENSLAFETWH